MRAHEITSNDQLDRVLVKLCDMIINCDGRPHSMVGAAVVDPEGRTVLKLGTPVSQDPELWCHAERTAIDAYHRQYGELPQGCVIVTTLSPCSDKRMKLRYDESCTDLLEQLGIQRVYCGYMDPSQDNGDHKFQLAVTGNSKLQELCKRIGDAVLNRDRDHLRKQGVTEGVPQPGESSGAPKQFGPDAEIETRQMTAKEIISSVPGVPYYNNVVDDWDAKDYSWNTTKKVIEYATYLKDHPESLSQLPPLIVLNGQFEDGAHRVSALWLLQQRMDPKNPLWANAKLNVQFVKQGVAEGLDPYRLEHLDPQTRRVLSRMANHAEPGSWLSAAESYAMQLGLQHKKEDPRGWEQEVQHFVDLYRQYSGQGVAEGQSGASDVKHVVTFTVSISPAATKSTVVKHYGRTKTFATQEAAVAWANKKNQIYQQENKPGRFEAATITDRNTGQQNIAEGRGVKQAIEEFLDSLSPDDVGIEEFPGYRVHYEGFTDDCKSSRDYQRNPDKVYQQVYNDFIRREGGRKPIESNMVGDEEYPILYSIFKIR